MTKPRRQAIITLLTDFGTRDSYVAEMKGAILSRFLQNAKPGTPLPLLIDVSHDLPPYDIEQAARLLSQVYPAFPRGTIHLAVVDPGVGGKRKAIVLEAKEHVFIGPDNGIFTYPARADRKKRVYALKLRSSKPAPTFHGRDVFAPCAADKALGLPSSRLGSLIPSLLMLEIDAPIQDRAGKWLGRVTGIDRFGNAATNLSAVLLQGMRNPGLKVKKLEIHKFFKTFSEVSSGQPAIISNGQGFLEIVLSQGSAARVLGLKKGNLVILSE